jgi:hypothetical protein
VASSCPRCDATLVPGLRICQFCGTPVEGTEPSAAEIQPAESPVREPAPEPLETAPSASATSAAAALPLAEASGSSTVSPKKRTLLYASMAASTLIVLVLVVSIARANFDFSFFGGGSHSFSADSPLPANAAPPASASSSSDLGIDIYPGARALSDVDRTTFSDSLRVSESFVSQATTTEVINFYKARMAGFASIYASGDGVVVSISRSAQDSVLVSISPAQSGGKTRFSISHTTTKSPN